MVEFTPGAPAGQQVRHDSYDRPLPGRDGTDAISIYHGQVLVSASAPGTTGRPGYSVDARGRHRGSWSA